jgi:CBS domain-containing protein
MDSTVKDVMSIKVIAVRPSAGYKEMAVMLRDRHVSAFPVIDKQARVIGVVSETDLLTKAALEGTVPRTQENLRRRLRTQVNALTAADLMTRPAVTIGPDEPVRNAARLMFNARIKRLPVVAGDGTLIGIVTRTDVLSVYGRPDADIRRQVVEELIAATSQGDPDRFAVTVKDGIVTIEGTPETTRAGHDIIDTVRRAEGVVFVRDRLSYPASSG